MKGRGLFPLPVTDKHPTIERYLTLADIALRRDSGPGEQQD
jgi:hypothetical protein